MEESQHDLSRLRPRSPLGLSVFLPDQAMEVVANRLERLGVALRVLADDAGPVERATEMSCKGR